MVFTLEHLRNRDTYRPLAYPGRLDGDWLLLRNPPPSFRPWRRFPSKPRSSPAYRAKKKYRRRRQHRDLHLITWKLKCSWWTSSKSIWWIGQVRKSHSGVEVLLIGEVTCSKSCLVQVVHFQACRMPPMTPTQHLSRATRNRLESKIHPPYL